MDCEIPPWPIWRVQVQCVINLYLFDFLQVFDNLTFLLFDFKFLIVLRCNLLYL